MPDDARRSRVAVLLAALAAASSVALAGPTSRSSPSAPSSRAAEPTSEVDRIARAIEGLNSTESVKREAALDELLSLRAGHLDAFGEALLKVAPLTPEQANAVREVGVHLYLENQKYELEAPPNVTCLGLTFGDPKSLEVAGVGGERAVLTGIEVASRVPGLPAYGALRDGDVIVSIGPGSRLVGAEMIKEFIRPLPPGAEVRMRVVRDGALREVRLNLAPRPKSYGSMEEPGVRWEVRWADKGQKWWDEEVVPQIAARSTVAGAASRPASTQPRPVLTHTPLQAQSDDAPRNGKP